MAVNLPDISKRGSIILYHGTSSNNNNISKFDIRHSRKSYLDLGIGIYFTTNFEQASKWALKHSAQGLVYQTQLNLNGINLKQYLTYSNEFIKTFCFCRAGFEVQLSGYSLYDAVYSKVIDNDRANIIKYTTKYALGTATEADVRNNIHVIENMNQICIKKQAILDTMTIRNIYKVTK